MFKDPVTCLLVYARSVASVVSNSLQPHGPQPARLSVQGLSRPERWSPPPGRLPDPGMEPLSLVSPVLAGGFFTTNATWEAHVCLLTWHLFPGERWDLVFHSLILDQQCCRAYKPPAQEASGDVRMQKRWRGAGSRQWGAGPRPPRAALRSSRWAALGERRANCLWNTPSGKPPLFECLWEWEQVITALRSGLTEQTEELREARSRKEKISEAQRGS